MIFPFALIGQSERKKTSNLSRLGHLHFGAIFGFVSKLWFSLVLLIFSFAMIGR